MEKATGRQLQRPGQVETEEAESSQQRLVSQVDFANAAKGSKAKSREVK